MTAASDFLALHRGQGFVLPNAWDPGSARLLEQVEQFRTCGRNDSEIAQVGPRKVRAHAQPLNKLDAQAVVRGRVISAAHDSKKRRTCRDRWTRHRRFHKCLYTRSMRTFKKCVEQEMHGS